LPWDWHEEISTALDGEIRIYTTTVPAKSRRVCRMQDRLYHTDVAMWRCRRRAISIGRNRAGFYVSRQR
jgi:trehalose utilization protein